jgi:GNAT superfamily N-acetyltransferase
MPRYKIDDRYSLQTLDDNCDWVEVLGLLKGSIEESPYHNVLRTDEQLLETIGFFALSPDTENVCILLLDGETYVGFLAAMVSAAHPLMYNDPIATELIWWVLPEHRGAKQSTKLIDAYEEWARMVGCKRCSMTNLMNKYHDRLDQLYQSKGFIPVEKSYMKEFI